MFSSTAMERQHLVHANVGWVVGVARPDMATGRISSMHSRKGLSVGFTCTGDDMGCTRGGGGQAHVLVMASR